MGGSVEGASKGFMFSALLVAAVGAILLAGLVLRTDRADPARPPVAEAPPPALGSSIGTHAEPAAPEPRVPVEPEPAAVQDDTAPVQLARLARRAEADVGRMSDAAGPWTAQLLVACKPETVDRVLAASAGSQDLYVLPARIRDEACFRVCFGSYPSAKEAAAAADLPAALRGSERIGAVEIVRVLP